MAAELEVPTPPEPPEMPPLPPEMPPDPDSEPEQRSDPVPPPPPQKRPPLPPGFEDLTSDLAGEPDKVDSWEDLPDGGDYIQSEPMRYEGDECGTWIRQEDDSWIRES